MLNKNIKHIIYSFYTYTDKQTAAPEGANNWRTFYRNNNNHLNIFHNSNA